MDYQKIYNQIIERAKNRNIEGYVEKHHVVPKCLGGEGKKENIVKLTAKEHFICHRLLCKMYPSHNGLSSALWLMINASRNYKRYVPSGRVYESLKKEYSQTQSKNMIGKKQSSETRAKKSKTLMGIKKSKEHIKNISKAKTGEGNHMFGVKGKNNKRSIITIQYDLKENFIKEWENSLIASKELNINYQSINHCCLNKSKSSGGFIWKYKIV